MDSRSKVWSTYVQRAETLYRSRNLRFRDEYRVNFLKAAGIKEGMDILEVGCGPGLLCHRLKEWLPGCNITGLDMDEEFISYAVEKGKNKDLECNFIMGDALSMPFPDNTFDACTSHTVIEHVPAIPFLKEQYRVCRPGGVVCVMSSRTEASINPENWQGEDSEEQELRGRADEAWIECSKNNRVCGYPCTVTEIPMFMENTGFVDICVDFIAITYAPDNANYNITLRTEFIESDRQVALDSISVAQNIAPGVWSDDEVQKLKQLTNKRFDERIKALHEGRKIWDINVSMLMIARGRKPC